MSSPAFRPDQFELSVTDEWSSRYESGIQLNAALASELANQVFTRNNDRRQRNERWPEETAILVALGQVGSRGIKRQSDGSFADHPQAEFGLGISPSDPFDGSTIYRAYLEGVQCALDQDEVQGYAAQVLRPYSGTR